MKKSLIKVVSLALITILFITSLSAISIALDKISYEPILVSEPNAKVPGYENPFEEIVAINSAKVKDLTLEFDSQLGNTTDFPSFYAGSYYSYDDKENITGIIFALEEQ